MSSFPLVSTSINDYQRYRSLLSGNEAYFASSFDLIETQTLSSSQASIVFSSLSTYSSEYKHLQLRYTLRGSRSADGETILMRINGDTGANYSAHLLLGDGSTVATATELSLNSMEQFYTNGASSTANVFSAGVIDFLDAFSTNKFKTRRLLASSGTNSNFAGIQFGSGSWRNTAAIDSISIVPRYGSGWAANSRFSLYGIRG